MRTSKIINRKNVLNEHSRILQGLEDRVKGIVVDVLSGTEQKLASELHGIALEVMKAVMEFEILGVAGAKGQHRVDRQYTRGGHNPGSVVIDGVKEPCAVPRVVAVGNHKSYSLRSYGVFHRAGDAVTRAYRALINGISTRTFAEGVGAFVEGYGLSPSTISRHMIAATARKVEELFTRPLGEIELAVVMIDGIAMGDHTVVIALGVDRQGVKHILSVRQGATENTEVVKGLLQELIERGISAEHPLLVVMDGSKALRRAVSDVFGMQTPVQRCTVHKKRNVLSYLPEQDRSWVSRRMAAAYEHADADKALATLHSLADQLARNHPDAAKSLLEGVEETVTVQRLGLPFELRRSLRSTNIIESANGGVRHRARNVTRWRGGSHIERWVAAGLLETEKKFRRIKGCRHMYLLGAALDQYKKQNTQAA